MRFEEIGVKDESDLEQDDFSLSRPTFGKDNQVTVIGWKGRYRREKVYIIECSECSKDTGLFGNGIFKTPKCSLIKGHIPCGCSNSPFWTESQYRVLIERKCKEKGYVFHGFVGLFDGRYTKLKLECPKHGMWDTSSLNNFLNKPIGCPECKIESVSKAKTKDDSLHINKFMSTGRFLEGTKFYRAERLSLKGWKSFWNYTCPICSNDEYVKADLCSGVFESHISSLCSGKLACRCSNTFKWTQDQYEYKIKKKMQESKENGIFLGFVNGFKNNTSKFKRMCDVHGVYETTIDSYLNANSGCLLCSHQIQQECYINFIKDNDSVVALKFGIAKDSKQRIKSQNSKSSLSVEQFAVWEFPTVKACKSSESYVKKHLPCRFLTKEQMPDGYTETTSPENLDYIINVFEKYGGVRKLAKDKENLIENNNKNKEAA